MDFCHGFCEFLGQLHHVCFSALERLLDVFLKPIIIFVTFGEDCVNFRGLTVGRCGLYEVVVPS